jgi:folate-binding protein YgfZ
VGLGDDVARLAAGTAFADRSDRGFVTVTGPDAFSFLQAVVSADLDPLTDGTGADSLLLAPQGKLDVAFRLLRIDGETVGIDCDPGLAPRLVESLLRYRIRVKAEVFDTSGEVGLLSFVGAAAPTPPATLPDALHAHFVNGDLRVVRTRHGYDVLGPVAELDRHVTNLAAQGVTAAVPEAYEAWRIDHGIAVQPFDLGDDTIPQEAFLERDAVSFTKGCFIGQELVCRIDTRGHVNRFLRVFDIDGAQLPPVGAAVAADGREVGVLTSVTPPGVPVVALGYVRREVEPPASVTLQWDGGEATARLRESSAP